MKINISLDLEKDKEEIVEMFSDSIYDEIIDFVLALDLKIADVGFTEKLIKALAKSLESDLSKEDIKELLK